jgi:polysaccharide pyruvyl transferase WcaK-like protein
MENDVAFYFKSTDLLKIALRSMNSYNAKILEGKLKFYMRSDVESALNWRDYYSDISVEDQYIYDLDMKEISLGFFLNEIANSSFIVTDRLHVGIAASILHIPCLLIDNYYGKNRSVYRLSLKNSGYILCTGATAGRLLLAMAHNFRAHNYFLENSFKFLLTIKSFFRAVK